MTKSCRILPHETGDGVSNMALDEALLDFVAADPSSAVVRTYDWSSPTLSLGYFQSIAEAEGDPRWADVPIVRRPTGGGALWHDREVTYAVVVPGDHPASKPSRTLYRTIHRAIADHLRSVGIAAIRRGDLDSSKFPDDRPFLCFTDRDGEDIVVREAKIVGSAQRRRSGAVLQHGSLLLGRSPKTPGLPGLSDLTPISSDISGWGEILRSILPPALGLDSMIEDVPNTVRLEAKSLAALRYGTRSWTHRR
jgi:lipoyl(octanoyl) transferase